MSEFKGTPEEEYNQHLEQKKKDWDDAMAELSVDREIRRKKKIDNGMKEFLDHTCYDLSSEFYGGNDGITLNLYVADKKTRQTKKYEIKQTYENKKILNSFRYMTFSTGKQLNDFFKSVGI